MVKKLEQICLMLLVLVGMTSCYPPSVQYPYTEFVTNRRVQLKDNLVALLPLEQQEQFAAHEEATWLADTAYKAAAGIARINGSCFPGWAGNALINARLQDRGLCWHYQHDLYRELRRRKLNYFALGCNVRDQGKGSEHNCVYVCAKGCTWPQAITLDAWKKNGRLVALTADELDLEDWADRPSTTEMLNWIYPEEHTYPVEHWALVKSGKKWNDYVPSWLDEGLNTRQGKIMQQNMYNGLQQRNGKPTDYEAE
jgi:hypothetical protein